MVRRKGLCIIIVFGQERSNKEKKRASEAYHHPLLRTWVLFGTTDKYQLWISMIINSKIITWNDLSYSAKFFCPHTLPPFPFSSRVPFPIFQASQIHCDPQSTGQSQNSPPLWKASIPALPGDFPFSGVFWKAFGWLLNTLWSRISELKTKLWNIIYCYLKFQTIRAPLWFWSIKAPYYFATSPHPQVGRSAAITLHTIMIARQ